MRPSVTQITDRTKVRSAFIPLDQMGLLLPNAVVAEVIEYRQPAELEQGPSWCLGSFHWRGHQLPLLVYEQLVGKTAKANISDKSHIVVVYSLGDKRQQLPYMGLLSQGLPHLRHVGTDNISQDKGGPDHTAVAANVILGNKHKAAIPNIDAMVEVISVRLPDLCQT